MQLRRLLSVLSVVVVASAGGALAQPTKAPTPAPAPASAPAPTGSATPAAAPGGGDGSAVQPIEDAPPSDMEGRDENPDAPRGTDTGTSVTATTPGVVKTTGYPIAQSQRPITLPQGMAEVSIQPHAQVSKVMGGDALRARYGITKQVQLGLTYVFGGIYDDPTTTTKKYAFHVGKAAGLDVSVLLTNFLAVKVGVPVYFDPVAVSFTAGAPMKFILSDKLAIGALDDVVNVRISKFPVSFYQEQNNAVGAYNVMTNTGQSRGILQFAGYAEYNQSEKLAVLGRVGLATDLGAGGGNGPGTSSGGGNRTFIRGGLQYTPKKYLDVGGMLGFDDLSKLGSFSFFGILAARI